MSSKTLSVYREFKIELRDFAWANRTSMSGLIHEVIRSYANGTLDYQPGPSEPYDEVIGYTPPPEYTDALARAVSEGVPLSDVIRAGLASRINGA